MVAGWIALRRAGRWGAAGVFVGSAWPMAAVVSALPAAADRAVSIAAVSAAVVSAAVVSAVAASGLGRALAREAVGVRAVPVLVEPVSAWGLAAAAVLVLLVPVEIFPALVLAAVGLAADLGRVVVCLIAEGSTVAASVAATLAVTAFAVVAFGVAALVVVFFADALFAAAFFAGAGSAGAAFAGAAFVPLGPLDRAPGAVPACWGAAVVWFSTAGSSAAVRGSAEPFGALAMTPASVPETDVSQRRFGPRAQRDAPGGRSPDPYPPTKPPASPSMVHHAGTTSSQ